MVESLWQKGVSLPGLVFKYCSYDIGRIILNTCELKMSEADNVNDPNEFSHGGYRDVDTDVIKSNLKENLFPIVVAT